MVNVSGLSSVFSRELQTRVKQNAQIENYYKVKNYYTRRESIRKSIEIEHSFEKMKQEEGTISSFINKIFGQDKRCDMAIEAVAEGQNEAFNVGGKKINKAQLQLCMYKLSQMGVSKMSELTSCSAAAGTYALTGDIYSAGAAGAVTNILIKGVDRATNKIPGDAFNKSKVLEDGISGCTCGIIPDFHDIFECIPALKNFAGEILTKGKNIKKS